MSSVHVLGEENPVFHDLLDMESVLCRQSLCRTVFSVMQPEFLYRSVHFMKTVNLPTVIQLRPQDSSRSCIHFHLNCAVNKNGIGRMTAWDSNKKHTSM